MPPDDHGLDQGLAAWGHELRVALGRLEPTQSKVLRMAYLERRTPAQIAAALDLPRPTVSRSLAAGMQALAVIMLGAATD